MPAKLEPCAPRSAPTTGLRVEALVHAFKARTVVDGIDLAIGPGELHCLVGPSGCGKTTTLRLVAGLEELQHGRITIGGTVVAEPGRVVPPERRRVGLMFQDFALFPHLKVWENVAFGMSGMAAGARRRRVDELLAQVNMADHAGSYPFTLSGGEQQRVALARALAAEPCLMLLDEPFSSLDTTLRAKVRAEVVSILRHAGTPTLLVTHEADEAIGVGDRIHVMRAGRILQSGTPAELYAKPEDPSVVSFFGEVNRFKGWVVDGRVSTPLADVPAPDLDDGSAVDVYVRPSALRLMHNSDGGQQMRLRVVGLRDIGPARLLDLMIPDGPRICLKLTHVPAFAIGDDVAVSVDHSQVFVFPTAT